VQASDSHTFFLNRERAEREPLMTAKQGCICHSLVMLTTRGKTTRNSGKQVLLNGHQSLRVYQTRRSSYPDDIRSLC
jgi:hypothetical protein